MAIRAREALAHLRECAPVSGNNREPGRSVLSKGFAILSALRTAETGLTRPQIARRTGLPMTTVLRLSTELRDMGALELDDHGIYRLGAWLWELGTLAASRSTLREIALPYMEDLYEATHENVQLAVRDGYGVLIVERIRGPRSRDRRQRCQLGSALRLTPRRLSWERTDSAWSLNTPAAHLECLRSAR